MGKDSGRYDVADRDNRPDGGEDSIVQYRKERRVKPAMPTHHDDGDEATCHLQKGQKQEYAGDH